MGNKGGVAIGFTFRETTRLAFVSAHLAARATRLAQRAANYADIVKNVALGSGKTPFLHQYHHVFWLGDLNYRTDFGNHGSDKVCAPVVAIAVVTLEFTPPFVLCRSSQWWSSTLRTKNSKRL